MGTQLDVLRFLFLWHCLCGWLPPPEWQPDESRGSTTLSFRTFGSSRAARVWNRLVVSTFQNLSKIFLMFAGKKSVCWYPQWLSYIFEKDWRWSTNQAVLRFCSFTGRRIDRRSASLSWVYSPMCRNIRDETWWSPLRLFHIDHIG